MVVVAKWWNRKRGRQDRRDIRLSLRWEVEALTGGADGRIQRWRFDDEPTARAWVEHLKYIADDDWTDVTRPAPRRLD